VDLLWSALVSGLIVAAAAAMIVGHLRAWREARDQVVDTRQRDFRWRQFRRRMQTSVMLGLLGLAIFCGRLLMLFPIAPVLLTLFWIGVLLLLAWVALLAGVDIWATKYHFGRMRSDYLIEQTKLQAELYRLRNARRNGQAADEDRSTPSDN
jgi:hypothetical protein